MPAFDVQTFLRVIVEEHIDLLTSVPAIFWLAMNQPNFKRISISQPRPVGDLWRGPPRRRSRWPG